jgi:hypothetical protein
MALEVIPANAPEYVETMRKHNAAPAVTAVRRHNLPLYEEFAKAYNEAVPGTILRLSLAGKVTTGNFMKVLENRGVKPMEDYEVSRCREKGKLVQESPFVVVKTSNVVMRLVSENKSLD